MPHNVFDDILGTIGNTPLVRLNRITAPIAADISNTQALGLVLYTRYVYFFQAAGVVLLVAMVGAIVLTLHHKPNVRRQNIAEQIARTKATAIEIVAAWAAQVGAPLHAHVSEQLGEGVQVLPARRQPGRQRRGFTGNHDLPAQVRRWR